MTRPASRLDALDGVRAVAALAVLVTHVAFQTGSVLRGPFGAVQARLDSGVAVFFALSGFLLVRPFLKGALPSTGTYLIRRAARILPAYWLAMTVALIADSAGRATVVAHIWVGQVYFGRLLDDFSQTWSLSAEVAFYLVLPFAAPALARRSTTNQLRILGALSVAGLALTWLVRADSAIPARAGFWMPLHLAWFAGGIALAVVTTGDSPRGRRLVHVCANSPGTVWATAGVVLLVASTPIAGPLTVHPIDPAAAVAKEAIYALLAVLVLAPFVVDGSPTGLRAALQSTPARWVGTISYGVFLWHLLVLRAVFDLTSIAPFTGRELPVFILTLLGTLIVAAVSWYGLERPVLALVHRRTRGVAQGAELVTS